MDRCNGELQLRLPPFFVASLLLFRCVFLFLDILVTGAVTNNLLRANGLPLFGVTSDGRRSRFHACRKDTI